MTDIETAMDATLKQIQLWDEDKSKELAARLQLTLTVLKMLVGVDKFNELPAFDRYLSEVTQYLSKANQPYVEGETLHL